MSYSAILGGFQFFDECSKEKNGCAAGESGGRCKLSSKGSRGYFAFRIAQHLSLQQAICLFLDELIFTLLRVWGSEFGIPN